ncbi:protein kinase domain-containing protein [Salipaludibacillus sp. HK11]|uniref:protein kinase domain-containing protein n=1 Tax=Salipaludibacillus sp. HK11 TaxID=3394320 RepID=UPI0039FCDB31
MNWRQYQVNPIPIGKGLSGKVYHAYDRLEDRFVAIKRMGNITEAKKEANIMKHYGVCPYLPVHYELFLLDQRAYLVMEYIEGKQLGFHTPTNKRTQKQSVQITINILKGLSHLHQSGFTHNDIKPKNIMLKGNSFKTVKVIDFNWGKKIKNRQSIRQDLHDTALLCIVMIKGRSIKKITGLELKNKQLMSVLMKAIKSTPEKQYHSAQQFMEDLRNCSTL